MSDESRVDFSAHGSDIADDGAPRMGRRRTAGSGSVHCGIGGGRIADVLMVALETTARGRHQIDGRTRRFDADGARVFQSLLRQRMRLRSPEAHLGVIAIIIIFIQFFF